MRKYLFRGKRKLKLGQAGTWVYGFLGKEHLSKDNDQYFIDSVPVDPNTVGQYLINDVNGKQIFEGDLVIFHYFQESYNPDTLGAEEKDVEFIGVVQVDEWGFYATPANNFDKEAPTAQRPRYYFAEYLLDPEEELEVIGNIYDNEKCLEKYLNVGEQNGKIK